MATRPDIISELVNKNTGENVFASIVTTNTQGIVLTDSNKSQYCGGLYTSRSTDDGTQFLKWNTSGYYPVSRLTNNTQENFQKLINDFGNNPGAILIDKTVQITSSMEVPENIQLSWTSNAVFDVSTGVTLTLKSSVKEGDTVLFSGLGSVLLKNKIANAVWFGVTSLLSDISPRVSKAFESVPNGTVELPRGIYQLASLLLIPDGNSFIGTTGSFINFANIAGSLRPQSNNKINFLNFTGVATRAIAIVGTNAKNNIDIQECSFTGQGVGVYIDRGSSTVCYNIKVNNNRFFNMTTDAILCINVYDSQFCNNYIRGTSARNIEFYGGKRNIIDNNDIQDGITGIAFIFQWSTAGARGQVDGNKIRGNTIRNISEESISMDCRGNIADDMSTREKSVVSAKSQSGGNYFINLSHASLYSASKPFVGAHFCFFTGTLKGQTFEIRDYSTPNPDVRFNIRIPVDLYSLVQVGDEVIIGAPFTNNIISNNHVVMEETSLTGIYLYGLSYFNTLVNNNVSSRSTSMIKKGIACRSLGGLNKTGSLTDPIGGRDAPCENNTFIGNTLVNCNEVSDYFGYGSAVPYMSIGNRHVSANIQGRMILSYNQLLVNNSNASLGFTYDNTEDSSDQPQNINDTYEY